MRIQVLNDSSKAGEGLRNYVGLRLMSVLDHLARQVEDVTVSVADVAGPHAAGEKRCRMLARLAASGEVAVEQVRPGLYQAIDHAAELLAQGVAREAARRRPGPVPVESAFGRAAGSRWVPENPAARRAGTRRRMRIHVHGRGFELTEALRVHGERRLLFALSRFAGQVQAVRLALDDMNGPRGGIDKRCQIAAQLAPWGEVRVEQLDGDLYAAIDRAADRARHAVAREIERRREMRLAPATRAAKDRLQ